jgi:hypothetical protein
MLDSFEGVRRYKDELGKQERGGVVNQMAFVKNQLAFVLIERIHESYALLMDSIVNIPMSFPSFTTGTQVAPSRLITSQAS